MKLFFILLILSTSVFSTEWKKKESPNFKLYYEGAWTPGPIMIELEKIFSKMKLNISAFAPWMIREKTNIYIYKNQKSYSEGEFKPPEWSKGLAFFDKKTVVVYDNGDFQKLKATIAHELTHLYFESYFAEKMSSPPQWLNEGLAVFMENMSYDNEGPWAKALRYTPIDSYLNFNDFFKISVDSLESSEKISNWYLEAYGVVSYLYQPKNRLLFKTLCDQIRDKYDIQKNLWKSYRIKNLIDFEYQWKKWLKEYQENIDKSSTPNRLDFKPFKQIEFSTK
jgi:hypothetical protein